jgi:hypothetical protein
VYASISNVGVVGFTADGGWQPILVPRNESPTPLAIAGSSALDGTWLFMGAPAGGEMCEQWSGLIRWGCPGDCYADCNGDGVLNILDFVCFQGRFQQGDLGADCDQDCELAILDFVCFQGAFQAGCH